MGQYLDLVPGMSIVQYRVPPTTPEEVVLPLALPVLNAEVTMKAGVTGS